MPNSEKEPDPPASKVPSPWQPRFGIGTLMLVTLVCSVMAASAYYLRQGVQGVRGGKLGFILFTLATPMLLMVVVSLVRQLVFWIARNRRNDS